MSNKSSWKQQLIALYPLEMPINTEYLDFENVRLVGDSATDPLELPDWA